MLSVEAGPRIRDDLDRRIELVPMDRYGSDISVALYLMRGGKSAVVHSYAGAPGVPDRLDWLSEAMRRLGGMGGTDRLVDYPCASWHDRAARRVFLEACKLDPKVPETVRQMTVADLRTNQTITVASLGTGAYAVSAVAEDPTAANRAPAVAAGLAKLAELAIDQEDDTVVRFSCGAPHDELMALILPRAINVRAAIREQELAATRGILVAPSAQAGAGE